MNTDASFEISDELIKVIFDLINFTESIKAEAYFIDVSNLFSFEESGVQHLLIQSSLLQTQKQFFDSEMRRTIRPFTNCTCAVLCNRNMAELLLSGTKRFSSIPGKRITPIDWSFNLVLLEISRSNNAIEFFHLDPWLFPQQSLVSTKEIRENLFKYDA